MSPTLSPILKDKPVIISAILTILSLIYKLIDAAGNAEFLLQKLGLNEDAARFLGSGRAIDVFVAVSLLALVLSLLYYANRQGGTFERRSSGEKRVSTVPPARQADTNHEDCQRQIRNLESTVSRLREHETTQGIQISARDTQIEQLQAKLNELKTCPYELVHRIADQEAKVIRDFVSVSRVGVWRHKLQDVVPAIKWGFMI
jgi:hypothetical protein